MACRHGHRNIAIVVTALLVGGCVSSSSTAPADAALEDVEDAAPADAGAEDTGSPDAPSLDALDGAPDVSDGDDGVGDGVGDAVDSDAPEVSDGGDGGEDGVADARDTGAPTDTGGDDVFVGFQPHTEPTLPTAGDFFALAADASEPAQVKFVITHFGEWGIYTEHYMDAAFYELHDEWYWYLLLNGKPIPGWPEVPVEGYTFATIDEIVAFFAGKDVLPLDLTWAGSRLYSPGFYAASLSADRFFGLGSVLHYPPNPKRVIPEELWVFELEYTDPTTELVVATFFERLKPTLPPEVAAELRWLARSPTQEALAAQIEAGGGPYADKVLTYADLVVEGEFAVYNPGIAAGRIEIIPKGKLSQASVGPDHIVILEEIPDYLPPVAAIVTAVPQTPLAHLNLLAKARGTPNAHVAGVHLDAQLGDWSYFKVPVVVQASEAGVTWTAISNGQFQTYKALLPPQTFEVESIDLETAPYWMELDGVPAADSEGLVPLLGGKSAHLAVLDDQPGIDVPDLPVGLSIRGFAEHLVSLEPTLEEVFAHDDFVSDPQTRFALLEGPAAYLESANGSVAAQAAIANLQAKWPAGTTLGDVLAAGGVRGMIRSKPVNPAFLTSLEAWLEARFATFDESQGLRFRSSSTAEDIEGFTGAGLYESHTGFLYPAEQKPADKKKSVAWAVRNTWSSYYSFEAFEERRLAGIDHSSGNMGVLVHARFDDDKEVSNGVFTLALRVLDDGPDTVLTVNVQQGALSVTNPPEGSEALPEIDVVAAKPGAPGAVERVQPSTQVEAGQWLLSDERLLDVHDAARTIAIDWLARLNGEIDPALALRSVVLDFEFRDMAAGWPTVQIGAPYPSRFVWKQVRTLDSQAALPAAILELPAPKDVLLRTSHVDRWTCAADTLLFEVIEIYTKSEQPWPFDHSEVPFTVLLSVEAPAGHVGLGLAPGADEVLVHPAFVVVEHPSGGGGWTVVVEVEDGGSALGIAAVELSAGGGWAVVSEVGEASGAGLACSVAPYALTPSQYLYSLVGE